MEVTGALNFDLCLSKLNVSVLMLNLCHNANCKIFLYNMWKLLFQSFQKVELLKMFYCFIIFCWVGMWN